MQKRSQQCGTHTYYAVFIMHTVLSDAPNQSRTEKEKGSREIYQRGFIKNYCKVIWQHQVTTFDEAQ
jgi:hypothetical protein